MDVVFLLLRKFWWAIPIALLALSTAYYRHDASSERGDRIRIAAEYDQFKVGVKLAGDAQNEKSKAQAIVDQQNAEKTNADNAKLRGDLDGVYAAYRKLRDSKGNTGSGLLPPASARAKSTGGETFDRAVLDRGLQDLDAGILRLIERGDKAIVDLNSAREWAQSRTEGK